MNWVLVHSPLVGSATWAPVRAVLRARGDAVAVPDLNDAWREAPPHHPRLAATVDAGVRALPPGECVLVTHSGAGPLVPAIVACEPRLFGAIVFVDATLPHPGRRWIDTVPADRAAGLLARAVDGRLPPWNEWFARDALAALLPDERQRTQFVQALPRVPVTWFEEVAPDAPAWRHVPAAYVRLSDAYLEAQSRAEAQGWPVRVLTGDHLAMCTRPAGVAQMLVDVVGQIRARRGEGPGRFGDDARLDPEELP